MGKFIESMKVSFKQLFVYRWTFAMSVLTQPILLIVNLILFTSIYTYNNATEIKGYSLEQIAWYSISLNIVNAFIWNSVAHDLSRDIVSGDFAMHLLRPYPYFRFRLAESVASRIIAQFMDFLPGMVIYSLILFPHFLTPLSFIKYVPIALLASMVNYLFSFILGLTAMSLKNNTSIIWLNDLFFYIAGGAIIPMEFYPDWLNRILDFLPFKYIIYWPIQFFLNKETIRPPEMMLRIVLLELLWIVVLYIIYKIMWKTVTKKFCSAGG